MSRLRWWLVGVVGVWVVTAPELGPLVGGGGLFLGYPLVWVGVVCCGGWGCVPPSNTIE